MTTQASAPDPATHDAAIHDLALLRAMPNAELTRMAAEMRIEGAGGLRRAELIAALLKEGCQGGQGPGEGVLEVLPEGFGFLRSMEAAFLPGPDDVYVSPSQIRRFGLRSGDIVRGQIRAPKESERYFALTRVDGVNGGEAGGARPFFEAMPTQWPRERLRLEHRPDEPGTRMIDLFCPLGRGSRSILLGPPRTGRTTLLQNLCRAVAKNHPEVIQIVLLIGERPEEISETWGAPQPGLPPMILATSQEEPDQRHVQVAALGVERAKRLAESGRDVLLICDSLSRLARAAQAASAPSGRTTIYGWDAQGVYTARALLGAARALKPESGRQEGRPEGGAPAGSLTVVGVLTQAAGSRIDAGLWEEFSGMETQLIALTRELADRRIFPALDIAHSGTLHEEHLWTAAQLSRLRNFRSTFPNAQGVLGRVSRSRSNAEIVDDPA